MEEKQLPKEVENAIIKEAYLKFNYPSEGAQREAYREGATAYASKLHQLQQVALESDKQRKEANDQLREAKKLLNEVFRKHEAGLHRFIYEKIKSFLYGE